MLLTVDTLRTDRIGAHGNALDLTPQLDRLAADSVVFERAYAPAPFTLPSVAALLTGRFPEELGVHENRAALPAAVPTIATLLQAAGYRTGAVVSNFVLRPKAGLGRGFDHYDAHFPQREASRGALAPERTAGDTTDAALRLAAVLGREAAQGSAPIFLWVHYQDPHGPYTPPDGFRERYLEAERLAPDAAHQLGTAPSGRGTLPEYQQLEGRSDVAFYRAGYDGEVRYVDQEMGRLIAGLGEQDWFDSAVLIFSADHGESLGEDDYWFSHGELLHDAALRVPLWIRLPGRAPEVVSDPVSLVDLLPTLAALTGLDPPPQARGRDLLAPSPPADAPRTVYASNLGRLWPVRLAIIAGDLRYEVGIERDTDRKREGLTVLGAPDVDLKATRPARLVQMRRRLRALRQSLGSASTQPRPTLSPQEEESLRALGYVEAPGPPEAPSRDEAR